MSLPSEFAYADLLAKFKADRDKALRELEDAKRELRILQLEKEVRELQEKLNQPR